NRQAARLRNLGPEISDDLVSAIAAAKPATLRPHQRRVLEALAQAQGDIIYVAGTGSGKSVSFIAPSVVSPTGVTVLVIPLKSLQLEILARFVRAGVTARVW
ncbi:hypothetical protein LY76DRAFT_488335, partial [Colletotrichum caudatum]